METVSDRTAPTGRSEPKRVAAKKRLRIDWHDFLVNTREPGTAYSINYTFRPRRKLNKFGLQYKAQAAGVTGSKEFEAIQWPQTVAGTVVDGSITWVAEAITTGSLRATVSSEAWTADTGITLSDQSASDLVHTTYATGGVEGQDYNIRHRITLSGTPGEIVEGLIILPVRD